MLALQPGRAVMTRLDDCGLISSKCKVFDIEGIASAQLPMRLLGLFAQQDLLPHVITMRRSRNGLVMRIVEKTLDDHRAAVILAKMQSFVEVEIATLDGAAVPPVGLSRE